MDVSKEKKFTHKAQPYTSFYNETGEPRVNIEGIVEVAGGSLESSGGSSSSPQFHYTDAVEFENTIDKAVVAGTVFYTICMDSFTEALFQVVIESDQSFEVKIYGTLDADLNPPADFTTVDPRWHDLTTQVFGAAVSGTSIQAKGVLDEPWEQVIIGRSVATDTDATTDVFIAVKKYYA